jgi:hypothetical protein
LVARVRDRLKMIVAHEGCSNSGLMRKPRRAEGACPLTLSERL